MKSETPKQIEVKAQEEKKRKVEESAQNGESSKQQKITDWIAKGIVVKVMNKQLANGKYYKQKGLLALLNLLMFLQV